MKAAVTLSCRNVTLVDLASPSVTTGTALVGVTAVGLCGTDHHIWQDSYKASHLPLVQGHEIVGRLLEAPNDVRLQSFLGTDVVIDPAISCGSCFACMRGHHNVCENMQVLGVHLDGGLCQVIQVPSTQVHSVGKLPPRLAVLVEPASIALEAVHRAQPEQGEACIVFGCGPIGLWAIAALRDAGVQVGAVDPNPWRRDLALAAGAEIIANITSSGSEFSIAEWARKTQISMAIEASGAKSALRDCMNVVRNSGRVVVVGIANGEELLPIYEIPYKGIDIRGSRNSSTALSHVVDFVDKHQSLAEALITHTFPVEDISQAFDLLDAPDTHPNVGKVVITL